MASSRKEQFMQVLQLVVDLFQNGEPLAHIWQRWLMAKFLKQYIIQRYIAHAG
jgi:hypothetical protein